MQDLLGEVGYGGIQSVTCQCQSQSFIYKCKMGEFGPATPLLREVDD